MREDCEIHRADAVVLLDVLNERGAVALEPGVDDEVSHAASVGSSEARGDSVTGPLTIAHGQEVNLEHGGGPP